MYNTFVFIHVYIYGYSYILKYLLAMRMIQNKVVNIGHITTIGRCMQ